MDQRCRRNQRVGAASCSTGGDATPNERNLFSNRKNAIGIVSSQFSQPDIEPRCPFGFRLALLGNSTLDLAECDDTETDR